MSQALRAFLAQVLPLYHTPGSFKKITEKQRSTNAARHIVLNLLPTIFQTHYHCDNETDSRYQKNQKTYEFNTMENLENADQSIENLGDEYEKNLSNEQVGLDIRRDPDQLSKIILRVSTINNNKHQKMIQALNEWLNKKNS